MKYLKLYEAFDKNSNIFVVHSFDNASKEVQNVLIKNATVVDLSICELDDIIGVETYKGNIKPSYMADKKVVMINFERAAPEIKDYIENNLDVKWVHADQLNPEDVQGLPHPSIYQ
jgi:hypothetical protein